MTPHDCVFGFLIILAAAAVCYLVGLPIIRLCEGRWTWQPICIMAGFAAALLVFVIVMFCGVIGHTILHWKMPEK